MRVSEEMMRRAAVWVLAAWLLGVGLWAAYNVGYQAGVADEAALCGRTG